MCRLWRGRRFEYIAVIIKPKAGGLAGLFVSLFVLLVCLLFVKESLYVNGKESRPRALIPFGVYWPTLSNVSGPFARLLKFFSMELYASKSICSFFV